MEQLLCSWWAFRGWWGMGSALSSDGLKEAPFSGPIVVFLHSRMATAYLCPSCTFKLQSLCNWSCLHPLNIFWCPLGIRHHAGLHWHKNECKRWVHRLLPYNVIEPCWRNSESSDWWLVYPEKLLDGEDARKSPFCKCLPSLLCLCSNLVSQMPWTSMKARFKAH